MLFGSSIKSIALSKSTSYIAQSSKQLQQLAQQLDMNTVIRQEIEQNFIRKALSSHLFWQMKDR